MAKRAFVGWACLWLLLGCSAEPPAPQQQRSLAASDGGALIVDARDVATSEGVDCAAYQQYGAALATFTLECLGTIGLDSYRVGGGKLERGFAACPLEPSKLRDIDAILSLQLREARAPQLGPCLARRYSTFLAHAPTGVSACPTWRKLETVNPVTPAIIASTEADLERAFLHPSATFALPPALEERNLWAVSFEGEPDSKGRTAGAVAASCAGGFDGFVLGHERQSVLTDPPVWLGSWTYPDAAADPFLRPGYFHPMSFYGPPPGAIFAHYNRYAPCPGCPPEACSYFAGIHRKTRLQADCFDVSDINTCVAYCGPPLP